MGFIEDQLKAWRALRGETVARWEAVEMALREDVDGAPQFRDDDVPGLQLLALDAVTARGRHRVGTYQNDDTFGLHFEDDALPRPPGTFEGIFRERHLDELPTGHVDDVRIALSPETGDVAEVLLRIEGQPLLLVAGELYEEGDGRLLHVRDDESVLVFTEPAIADTIPWSPPRPATSGLTWQ